MFYTIGYQGLTVNDFINTMKFHGIGHVFDIRSKPYSRKKDYNREPFRALLQSAGLQYSWVGDRFGGFGEIEERDVIRLADLIKHDHELGKTYCLMCMEAAVNQCHRKDLAGRLANYGTDFIHLEKGDLFSEKKKELSEKQLTIYDQIEVEHIKAVERSAGFEPTLQGGSL